MSPFFWRVVSLFSILFLLFTIVTITITLLLINEVKDGSPDNTKVTYVQVANWIYVGLMASSILAFIVGTPYLIRYTRRAESIVGTGLKPASQSRAKESREQTEKTKEFASYGRPDFYQQFM